MFYYHQFLGDSSLFQGIFLITSSLSDCLLMIYRPWSVSMRPCERVCLPRLLLSGWATAAALCCLPARLPVHPGHQCHHHLHHCADRALHTPMYFFLTVLSCFETGYTLLVIVPKMLVDLLAQKKTISFWAVLCRCFPSSF